ncbi:MAG TPA: hypothetical protein VFP22_10720, partial [Candidatus Limnocylindrales bacterium]|nr:hypothetical protein [Candidatus Limnocylindrales bacterium]
MGWLVASLRRLRQGRIAAAGIAGLVLATAFLAAAGPRLFETVARDSIHGALAQIPASDRVIRLTRLDGGPRLSTGATSVDLNGLDGDGQALRATFPDAVGSLLGATSLVIETPSFRSVSGTSLAAELRLRIMPGADSHVRIVDGRAPTGTVGSAPDPLHSGSQPGEQQRTIIVLEAAISRTAADKLGLSVGSQVVMVSDVTLDPQAAGSAIAVKIVGTFEPADPADPFWVDDGRVLGYSLREYSANVTFIQSTMLLSPDALGPLVGTGPSGNNGFTSFGPPPRRVTWRFPADPSRLEPDALPATIDGLRRLETLYPAGDRAGGSGVALDSGLLGRLVALQGPWDAAGAVLGVAAVGAAAVALAALALVIALTADARRRVLVLQRERGASTVQSILAVVIEAALVTVPAGLVGAAIAVAVVPGRDPAPAFAAGVLVAVAAIAIDLGLVIRSIVGPPRQPGRSGAVVRSVRPRRLVFEILVVGVAAVGAVTLRDRGLQVASAAGVPNAAGTTPAGADPFLAVVPVLVGVAAALVALRL